MPQSKLFIGSSQKNLRVAKVLAKELQECAEVTVWDEGVFGLNQGYLETLLKKLKEYDFAAFILAPDDMTLSKDETKPAPRDNVLFEGGLFMGVLGRERVFLVYDQAVGLKIPSDLAGITLASYDGARIESPEAAAAVRTAGLLISEKITALRFPHLIGEWKSRYPMTHEEGMPLIDEDVEIRASRNGISISSKSNSQDDNYTAFGSLPLQRQIMGEWNYCEGSDETCGLFVLTVSPSAKYMYGYFTSPDETGGVIYAPWVLAKVDEDDVKVDRQLKHAQDILKRTTISLSAHSSGS